MISKNFKFGSSTNINPTPVETKKYETTRPGSKKILTREEQLKKAAEMTKQSENLFTAEQKKNLKKLKELVESQKSGIIETDDFKMTYSEATNKFYIQKKTPQTEEKLKEFLKDNNVLDIYNQRPSFFILTNEGLDLYVEKQEDEIIEISEMTEGAGIEISGTPGTGGTGGSTGGTGGTTGTGGTGGSTGGTGGTTGTGGTSGQSSYEQIRQQNREKNFQVLTNLVKELFSPSTAGTSQLADLLTGQDEEPTPTQEPSPTSEPSSSGTSVPSNLLGPPNEWDYYLLPNSPLYSYSGWGTCESHRWGSKELINAIYSAASAWKAKYPGSNFTTGDLNGPISGTVCPGTDRRCGHSSHGDGTGVDIMIYKSPGSWVSFGCQINAPEQNNIDIGKMLIDTGVVKKIIFATNPSDTRGIRVRKAWTDYAESKGLTGFDTYALYPHDDHCHVAVDPAYALSVWRPTSCCYCLN